MRWVVLVSIVASAACDTVLGLERPPDAGVALPPCASDAGIDDDFESASEACKPWGSVTENSATVTVDEGRILISPTANASTFGGCITPNAIPVGPAGAVLDVTAALSGATVEQSTTYLVFHVYGAAPAGALFANIKQEYGRLGLYVGTQLSGTNPPYDPIRMRWWRVRAAADNTGMLGEYSSDAVNWEILGKATGTVPTHARIDFGAGTNAPGAAQPGVAAIGRLQVCAP